MENKLTWQEIEKHYDKEWIELVEYEWPENEVHPRSGIVRVHSKSRKEFDRLIQIDPPAISALVFIGAPTRPGHVILSANLHRVDPANA